VSNDSVIVDDIFDYFSGYVFGNFREKANILSSVQKNTTKKAVL